MPAPISPVLTQTETLTHLALSAAALSLLVNTLTSDPGQPLLASLALSILAFSLTYAMIRWLAPSFVAHGFKGRDLCKAGRPELPECMGAVCAVVYLIAIIVFIPFPFYKDIVAATSGGGNRDVVLEVQYVNEGRFLHRFPHSKVRASCPRRPDASHAGAGPVRFLQTDSPPKSSRPTSRRSSPSRQSPFSALATTSSTSAGATSGGFPLWLPSLSW